MLLMLGTLYIQVPDAYHAARCYEGDLQPFPFVCQSEDDDQRQQGKRSKDNTLANKAEIYYLHL